jgi:hypothetical protein
MSPPRGAWFSRLIIATDQGGGKRRWVISRKSGAESDPARAYTCVVELVLLPGFPGFHLQSDSPMMLGPLQGSALLGDEGKAAGCHGTPWRLCCVAARAHQVLRCNSSGSLAILAAIRRARSRDGLETKHRHCHVKRSE